MESPTKIVTIQRHIMEQQALHPAATGEFTIRFAPPDNRHIRRWVVQTRAGGAWRTVLLPGTQRTYILKGDTAAADLVNISAVDRAGNVSAAAVLHLTP